MVDTFSAVSAHGGRPFARKRSGEDDPTDSGHGAEVGGGRSYWSRSSASWHARHAADSGRARSRFRLMGSSQRWQSP
jgi:hypothetical protein